MTWFPWGVWARSYWCALPEVPDSWRTGQYASATNAYTHGSFPLFESQAVVLIFESQAVVLTESEIDATVAGDSVARLSGRIKRLWGGILPESVFASELFGEWLSYFIKHNHDFGIVHA